MRKLLTVTMALSVLAAAAPLTAQQPPEVKPGPEHKMFKDSEGTWELTFKTAGEDSKGTSTGTVGLGGLWLLEHVKADFSGLAYEGRGSTTYDPAKKKYINVWIDSMSTHPMISEGTYDKGTKTLTMVGKMPTPDGKTVKA